MKSLPIFCKMNDRPLYDEVFLCYNKTIVFVLVKEHQNA